MTSFTPAHRAGNNHMNEGSTFGFKGFAILFAFLVIGFAGAQSQPGGQFDLLMKVVRKTPPGKKTATTGTTTTATTASATVSTPTTSSSNMLYSELTAIPSTFDINPLIPTHNDGIPASMAPDVVGAFRFMCAAGQLAKDDPIVYPGQPGKSHLHQFYGNLNANANSTYASLRQNGGSSCEGNPATPGQAVNRSAYWMPAMLDGKGSVVRPDFISIYYKRRPISDPKCSLTSGDPQAEGNCVPLPNGLRYIFGYDMVSGQAATGSFYFNCDGPTAVSGHYGTITEAMAHCPTTPTPVKQWDGSYKDTYNRLGAVVMAPSCWDGKNLDSANHRDHVAYGGYGGWGYFKCPPTHPFVIPSFQLGAWFRVDQNLGTWHFSSDEMHPDLPPGSTFHADWFGAWDNQVEAMWMDNCINKLLNCSGGDLGNGRHIWGMWGTWEAVPRLVPVPA